MTEQIMRAGRALAYVRVPGSDGSAGQASRPGIVFLGGLRSDMSGTKAVALERWAKARGQAFLRLDYSGHGASEGAFEEGTIGDWYQDAVAVIASATQGPQVIVGSSMGGWIALMLARDHPERIAGLVTIAAAPDFTEDGFAARLSDSQRAELSERGRISLPSEYGEPMVVTRRLIEEGRDRLVLRRPLRIFAPVRMLQGTADRDVSVSTALRLLDHAEAEDMRLTLVDGADHRFSTPDCLRLIERSVEEVLDRARR